MHNLDLVKHNSDKHDTAIDRAHVHCVNITISG